MQYHAYATCNSPRLLFFWCFFHVFFLLLLNIAHKILVPTCLTKTFFSQLHRITATWNVKSNKNQFQKYIFILCMWRRQFALEHRWQFD